MQAKYLPSVRLLYHLSEAERVIAASAKATFSPREFIEITRGMERENIEKWLLELVARGHGSPLEHSIYVFEVICSRVCSHQLVRHRHASYTQLSQRYSDKYLHGLLEKASQILGTQLPSSPRDAIILLEALEKLGDFDLLLDTVAEAFIVPPSIVKKRDITALKELVRSIKAYYSVLVSGVPYEDARYLLPQAVKTRIVVSMNAREIVEVFLPLRMCSRAQWEIRMVAWELWKQLVAIHPGIFKYTGPRCILMENRVKTTPCTLEDYLEGKCIFTIERCPERVSRDHIYECVLNSYRTE